MVDVHVNGQRALPAGWTWSRLEQCVEILDRHRVPVNGAEREERIAGLPPEKLVPYYGATGQVGWIDRHIFDEELVLLGEDGAPFLDGHKDVAYMIRGKSWVNNHAHVLRAARDVTTNAYLRHYLNTIDYRDFVTGTTRLKLNQARMRQIPVPLSPISQQEQIVAEIDKQLTRLDAAVTALKRAQANLARYKAAVLKAAVEGRLVPQDPNDEPAAVLLERILAERRRKWQEAYPNKKYVEPKRPETDGLPELPAGWVWVDLGYLFEVKVGSTPSRQKPEYWNGEIPWVSSGEVAFGRIKQTRESISQQGLLNSSVQVNPPGTVLLAMIGEGKTRGQAAILDIAATNNQNAAAILCADTPIPPEWVFFWLMSRYEQTRAGGSGGMQPALNSQLVRAIPLPVAPLNEMHRIVERVEEAISVLDSCEAAVNVSLARAEWMRQAILQRAFRGELIAQEPSEAQLGTW